jgi:hypothetical protein
MPSAPTGVRQENPAVLEGPEVMQEQYVTSDGYAWNGTHVLSPNRIDEIITNITPETFEQMSQDPKIHKSKRIRINGVLTDELQLAPGATEEEAANKNEYKKFLLTMHFCERMIASLETPLWRVLEQMVDGGWEQGHKIAESIWKYVLDKPTRAMQTGSKTSKPSGALATLKRMFGIQAAEDTEPKPRGTTILQKPQTRLMPKALKVKPRGSVLFCVDAFRNVLGLVPAWGRKTGSWTSNEIITRDKFLVYTNNPTDDDPRGNSAWRPVFWAWSFKNFIPKQYLTYLLNEAVPVPVLELPKGMQSWIMKRDKLGNIVYKKNSDGSNKVPLEPEMVETIVAANQTLQEVRGGKGVAIPPESKLTAYGGNRGGSQDTVFPNAIKAADEQIEEGIVLQGLAQSQGKSSSQKGAMTHENRLNDLFFWDKRALCIMLLYDWFSVGVRMNLGEEYLAYMPKASLGDSEKRDWARDLEVISKAFFYDFIDPTQRAELCAWLGLPKPGPTRAEMLAEQGKDGSPATPNSQRPDKQPDQANRNKSANDPNAQASDDKMDDLLETLYERVRNVEITEQGFSTVGNYRRGKRSFVGYLPGRA